MDGRMQRPLSASFNILQLVMDHALLLYSCELFFCRYSHKPNLSLDDRDAILAEMKFFKVTHKMFLNI